MKKPLKPKMLAMPKAPKKTASKETWDRYYQRVKAVKAENKKRMAEYNKKMREYEAEMKRRQKILEEARKRY